MGRSPRRYTVAMDPWSKRTYKRKKNTNLSSYSTTLSQRRNQSIKQFGEPYPFIRPDGVVKLLPGPTKYFSKIRLSDNSFIDDPTYYFIISNGLLSVNGCPKGTIVAIQTSTQKSCPSLESAWKKFGWYCLSSWVLSMDGILMMINTPSSIDEHGNVEMRII